MIRQPGANGNPYVPIIMLTGHSEKKRVIAARDAGVTEFLAKPISAKALYQRILNVVANPRPFIKHQELFRAGPAAQRQPELRRPRTPPRRQGRRDRQQPLLDKAKRPGMSGTGSEDDDKKAEKPAVADLRRPRGHLCRRTSCKQGGADGQAGRPREDREPVARAEAALAELSGEFSSWMDRNASGSTRRGKVKAAGFIQGTREALFHRRPRHQGRGRDLRLSAGRAAAESLCRLIEHTPDMKRSRSALVDQHVDAVRAIFAREHARRQDLADAARPAEAARGHRRIPRPREPRPAG